MASSSVATLPPSYTPRPDPPADVFRGRVAIITGASRGIGRQVALDFAKHGAKVVVTAKSVNDNPNLPGTIFSVAAEIQALPGREPDSVLAIPCDVRKPEQIEQMVAQVVSRWGRVDFLINNAGALWWKKMVDTPMKRYDLINEVNARGTFAACKAVLPVMLNQGFGHIINMSPPLDRAMLNGRIAYCLSKFGMTLIAHGLGDEVGGTGVACNALWPATMVESYATINFQLGTPELWRKATILSDACLMIAQEDPRTFTGQALVDEDYMRTRGITDFTHYRCDPNVEPPRLVALGDGNTFERGLVSDVDAPHSRL